MTRWLMVSILLAAMTTGVSFGVWWFAYDRLPEVLPIHWDFEGQVDGYMARGTVLILWPTVLVGWVFLTLVLPWISPRSFKVETFRETYFYVMALVAGLFAYMHTITIWGSLDKGMNLERWLFGGMFLYFALLGNVLGRVRRNFWIGVRTPWTLASDAVWDRTHRLAAWLFTSFGLLSFLAVLLGIPFYWCLLGIVVPALVPIVYSLWLYKRLEKEGRLQNGSLESVATGESHLPPDGMHGA